MSDIVHKGKCPFHFLEGTTRTIGDDNFPIVDLTQNSPPKKIKKNSENLIMCFKMFKLFSFLG